MSNTISSSLLSAIELILNRYIALNPEEQQNLEEFNGSVAAVNITGSSEFYLIKINGTQVFISAAQEAQADVIFSGPPISMVRYLLDSEHDSDFHPDIQISENVELGKRLHYYFAHFAVDWEEQLSHLTGDVIAHQIGNTVRKTKIWSEKTIANSKLNLKEYLQEEIRILPRHQEMDSNRALIEKIAQEVKMLESRIIKLNQ